MNVPFVDLKAQYNKYKSELDQAVKRVLFSAIFIDGEEVSKFEVEFSRYLRVKYCVGVNSGTDALILGIKALGIEPNSEVIIQANTYIASALAASENSLKPVFVEMDESDFGINLDDLKRKINGRTKAIIITHLYGLPDKISEICEIVKKIGKDIYIIEDACQAHGAVYQNKRVGGFGVFAAFSFYPSKNLGAYGDGGAIVTNDQKLSNKYRLYREYGQEKKYYHKTIGVNSRLDSLQAAILRTKLKYLDQWNTQRAKFAKIYTQLLNKGIPSIITPKVFKERESIYHVYCIRVENRNRLQNYLRENEIISQIHYPLPLHLQEAYKNLGYKKGDFPISEKVTSEILSLPMYPELTKGQIEKVVEKIKEFFR